MPLDIHLVQDPDREENEKSIRQRAREKYAYGSDNDIEIEEDAAISEADDGYWVAAWVWLFKPEQDEPVSYEDAMAIAGEYPDFAIAADVVTNAFDALSDDEITEGYVRRSLDKAFAPDADETV